MALSSSIGRAWHATTRAVLAILLCGGTLLGADEPVPEYDLKAAFLLNFVKFVQWPPAVFPDSHSPVVICLLRQNPFGATLAQLVERETVGGRRLLVRHLGSPDQIPGCHVVFVPRAVLAEDGDAAVPEAVGLLTVGEADTFLARGGIISFYSEGERIRFAINRDAAERSRIQLSARLLRVARVVRPQRGSPL
jgi:hypothetical protein